MAELNNPIPAAWMQYVTQIPGALEEVPSVLYDTEVYVDNTTTELNFFTDVEATRDLSNMTQPGMLPNPQSFLIECIQFFVKYEVQTADSGSAGDFASRVNDVALVSNTGIAQLIISEKRYGPWPLWLLSAGSFLQSSMTQAGAEAANLTQNYGQIGGPRYVLYPYLMISPLQRFQLDLLWPAGAVDTTANVTIQILFNGRLARAVQ